MVTKLLRSGLAAGFMPRTASSLAAPAEPSIAAISAAPVAAATRSLVVVHACAYTAYTPSPHFCSARDALFLPAIQLVVQETEARAWLNLKVRRRSTPNAPVSLVARSWEPPADGSQREVCYLYSPYGAAHPGPEVQHPGEGTVQVELQPHLDARGSLTRLGEMREMECDGERSGGAAERPRSSGRRCVCKSLPTSSCKLFSKDFTSTC